MGRMSVLLRLTHYHTSPSKRPPHLDLTSGAQHCGGGGGGGGKNMDVQGFKK